MFIGHYGIALAAKKWAPRTSLGVLFLAAQWVDLIMPFFLFAGLEHLRIDPGNTAAMPLDLYDYPLTHSLLTGLGWSVLVGGVYYAVRRRLREGLVVAGLVASHWVLDALMHRPDLPLYPGGETKVGLGLWNSIPATIGIEFLVFVGGMYLYLKTASPLQRRSRLGLWLLAGFLVAVWLGSIFGPPPPSETAVTVTGMALWLLVWWGDGIDRGSSCAETA